MVSGVNSITKADLREIRQNQSKQSHYSTVKYKKIASEQISQNEFIAQEIPKVIRAAIQTMATANMERQENGGIKMSMPILKQPMFNWTAEDKYEEL